MKENKHSRLFSKEYQSEISREILEKHSQLKKKDSELATLNLIAYVLKFKKKGLSTQRQYIREFNTIKQESIRLFRSSSKQRNNFYYISRGAAAACVMLLFGLMGYLSRDNQWFIQHSAGTKVIEFYTSKGQQSELTLPDGTFIALNYDSKLKYIISPTDKLQEVELEGEAFFKVTSDRSRLFRVITPNMRVNVLGTEFNIRAYNNDTKTEATLLKGCIKIDSIEDSDESVILKPGKQWTFDKNTNEYEVNEANTDLTTLWRSGEYYFDKITLSELALALERMYKVTIHLDDPILKNEVYSGSVYQEDSMNKIFEIINLTIPINIKTDGKDIWISRK